MFSVWALLHSFADWVLGFCKLCQNREVGWQTLDRRSGRYKREQQPLWKKFKLIILFNPLMDWIDSTSIMRLWMHEKTINAGKKEGTLASRSQIKSFVDFFHINMDDFEPSDISKYQTFEQFFVRKHKAGARPIHEASNPSKACVVADSRVVVYPTMTATRTQWIKGKHFTIGNLIDNEKAAEPWIDGAVASFRLSPQDYHRYHSPVTGTVKWYKRIPGDFYQVDPVCLQSGVDILTRNARCCVCIDSKEFGQVLFVAIGATDVGDVEIRPEMQEPGHLVRKGEEVGLFQFGGSSIIVAFEKGRIEFDDDLATMSRRQIMVDVEVGMSMGSVPPKRV
ncbi:phosphatidylserine decarboxylase [Coccidioides immitis RS]|uniref:phosphatidylserine decarboxylase n=2 Tax=Coccidioides immitis TaxID=5501 RepID=J3KLH7_COCIM|nr:phosphatidylserine decarboxylase [Coccidioides immitis RS]EAS37137.3 phosphatidylserine decarboxylase [Coccidioides immitis RS]KMP10080.1 phosphatidylserine decarboxylase proenzyme [Coccidioides immitis RMSCC 2394]